MTAATVHDPVCHMDIVVESAAGSSQFGGETYYFCSVGRKRDFEEDPEAVLKAEAEFDHSRSAHRHPARTQGGRPWWRFWSR